MIGNVALVILALWVFSYFGFGIDFDSLSRDETIEKGRIVLAATILTIMLTALAITVWVAQYIY